MHTTADIPGALDIKRRIAVLGAVLRPQHDLLPTWAIRVLAGRATVPVAIGAPGELSFTAELFEETAAGMRAAVQGAGTALRDRTRPEPYRRRPVDAA